MYKSLKIPFAAWQVLTRLTAHTGEPRSTIVVRLIRDEAQRLLGKDAHQDTNTGRTTTTQRIAEEETASE